MDQLDHQRMRPLGFNLGTRSRAHLRTRNFTHLRAQCEKITHLRSGGSGGVGWGGTITSMFLRAQAQHFHHRSLRICACMPPCLHASMIIHACIYVCLSVCLSICLSVCLSLCNPLFWKLCVCMHVCMYSGRYVDM